MSKHIGIVACSAEGAALCYTTICREGALRLGDHAHPEISMHTPSLKDYVTCLDKNDLQGVAKLMLQSAEKLAASGAQFLICPDNTIHQAFHYVAQASPLPWLHIADVVAKEAKKRNHKQLGILGTKWLVDSNVYPDKLESQGIAWLRPSFEERDTLGRIIMSELVYGVFKPESISYFQEVIRNMKDQGCDAVILGCTEIPLILNNQNSALATLDSTVLLAKAALDESLSNSTLGV